MNIAHLKASKLLNIISAIITLIALFYVANAANQSAALSKTVALLTHQSETLIFLLILYIASLFIQSLAWSQLIETAASAKRRQLIVFYGISQIYRYIPGNIAHYIARQFFAKKIKLGQTYTATISLLEAMCQITAASLLALLLALDLELLQKTFLTHIDQTQTFSLWLAALLVPMLAIISIKLIAKATDILKKTHPYKPQYATCTLLNFTYFFINGIVFALLISLSQDHQFEITEYFILIGAYNAAWLIGFLTPGSPAGLGVREVIIIMTLQAVFPLNFTLDNASVIAVSFRVLQMVGDGLYAIGLSIILYLKESKCTTL